MVNNLMILKSAINLFHEISLLLCNALSLPQGNERVYASQLSFFSTQDLLHSKDAFDILYCRCYSYFSSH